MRAGIIESSGLELLFAYGHSIGARTESYDFLGLYKTWGKDRVAGTASADDENVEPRQ
jgi:hypothetical protein